MSTKAETPKAYVTKRILVNASTKAVKEAYLRSMTTLGYSVEAKNGWVVKKYVDGRIEKISKIPSIKRPGTLVLR